MVLVLAWLYLRFGGLGWIQAAFYGVGAAVIAIVARSATKLVERTLGRDALLIGVAVVNAAVVVVTERELVGVLLASAMVVPLLRRPVRTSVLSVAVLGDGWWVTGLHGPAGHDLPGQILALFTKAAIVVFGSGLAVLPFLHGEVVTTLGWLTERQFLDAVAVAMITPGPVVITVGFIGYLVAGPLGGLLAALGMFLPTYLVVVIMAPWFRRIMDNPTFRSAVDGVTAAATGALAGAVIVLGRRALVDAATWGIALATLVLLWKARRIPEPLLILGAGAVGLLIPR
jgi:chromate transporter